MTKRDGRANAAADQETISAESEKAELARNLLASVRIAYWQQPIEARREIIGIARRRLVVRS